MKKKLRSKFAAFRDKKLKLYSLLKVEAVTVKTVITSPHKKSESTDKKQRSTFSCLRGEISLKDRVAQQCLADQLHFRITFI